ncbi:hypothetical protein ACXYMU_02835 [Pontibacter sp. CAU 1760]
MKKVVYIALLSLLITALATACEHVLEPSAVTALAQAASSTPAFK